MEGLAVNWEPVGNIALWLALGGIALAVVVVAGFAALLRGGGMVDDDLGASLPSPFDGID